MAANFPIAAPISFNNDAQDCLLWYYRDKSCNEIDMVIESDGELHPLELVTKGRGGEALRIFFALFWCYKFYQKDVF